MNMKEALAAAIKAAAVKAIAAGTIKEGDLPEVLLEVPPQRNLVILPPILPCSQPAA